LNELVQHHIQRLATLRSDRANFDSQWEEAAARLMPGHVNSFTARGMNLALGSGGEKKTEQMFDATAAFAALRFASVMESLATPQNSIWHILKVLDKTLQRHRSVRAFFDDLSQCLYDYRYRPSANFVGNSQQVYHGLGLYGNGSLFIDQPEQGRGLRYKNIHLAESYWVENHAGILDTLYRSFPLTARQIVQKFGAAAPADVQDMAKTAQQTERKYTVLHVVLPREDRDPTRLDAKGMPFASLYMMESNTDHGLLRESGFATFPYATARYTQSSGESYGRGPAQWVLPSIKVLNEQKKTVLKQGHRIVDPVLLAHDDGNLDTFSLKAGALNKGGMNKDGKRLIDVLPTGNLAVGDKMMDMEKAIINDAFLITLFQILIDTPQMTATEVLERAREKGMLLAPTAGRLQAEWLGPMIEREIDLLARQGLLPQIPGVLLDAAVEYKIEYDNPMARMAKAEKAAGFMRALASAAEYTKMTGDPAPLDHFNFDRAMPGILDINGAPVAWTSSEEEVMAKRQARAKAQQQQAAAEAAPAVAGLMKAAPAA
jgi:hypothetical protein